VEEKIKKGGWGRKSRRRKPKIRGKKKDSGKKFRKGADSLKKK